MDNKTNTSELLDFTTRATDFAARLYSGEMTAADELALESWLAEDASHYEEYRSVLDTWDCMGSLASDPEVLDYANGIEVTVGWGVWPKLAVAAGMVLAIGVGLLNIQISAPEVIRYATAIGEQKAFTLEDGTVMTLNTNTKVLVDYTEGYRRTIIDQGEAFFEVAKDMQRPFLVDTGARAVTALGTSFNVYKAPLTLKVAVIEGLVAVYRKEGGLGSNKTPTESTALKEPEQYLLKPGALLSFDDLVGGEPVLVNDMSLVSSSSRWRTGSIRFDKKPLSDVVSELNRYSRKKILVEDRDVMDIKVSAIVHLDELEEALDGMERGLPLRITYYEDRIVVTDKRLK